VITLGDEVIEAWFSRFTSHAVKELMISGGYPDGFADLYDF
jgi:hypothetical protein